MTQPVDDERDAVGPLLAWLVGSPLRRRLARVVLGPPVLLARWLATRRTTHHEIVRVDTPGRDAPRLATFPEAQPPSAGVGGGVHRTYAVRVPGRGDEAAPALARLAAEPNLHCTIELGSFESDDDEDEIHFTLGRDLRVALTGPFHGPVRVVEATDHLVRLQTRGGHVEAGQVLFEAVADGDDLVFTIASWTRNRDRLVDVLYRAGPARWLQQHMWISVCRQVARGVGADDPVVVVRTELLPSDVALLGEATS